jgi:hypothetical protein
VRSISELKIKLFADGAGRAQIVAASRSADQQFYHQSRRPRGIRRS